VTAHGIFKDAGTGNNTIGTFTITLGDNTSDANANALTGSTNATSLATAGALEAASIVISLINGFTCTVNGGYTDVTTGACTSIAVTDLSTCNASMSYAKTATLTDNAATALTETEACIGHLSGVLNLSIDLSDSTLSGNVGIDLTNLNTSITHLTLDLANTGITAGTTKTLLESISTF
jgi:hypothetical protein